MIQLRVRRSFTGWRFRSGLEVRVLESADRFELRRVARPFQEIDVRSRHAITDERAERRIFFQIIAARSGSCSGSDRNKTASTTLKTAALAPMPTGKDRDDRQCEPGDFRRMFG
jgi:hypothetical protein